MLGYITFHRTYSLMLGFASLHPTYGLVLDFITFHRTYIPPPSFPPFQSRSEVRRLGGISCNLTFHRTYSLMLGYITFHPTYSLMLGFASLHRTYGLVLDFIWMRREDSQYNLRFIGMMNRRQKIKSPSGHPTTTLSEHL